MAISSALGQTVSPWEVLVCDDGSTDESEAVVRSFEDPRVKWLSGPRAGRPAGPRNRGVAASEGEWIAFLDSDDRWIPEKLERQSRHADNLGCKAVCSNALRLRPAESIASPLLSWSKPKVTFDDLLYTNYVVCSSAMIHSSLVADVGVFPEDADLKGSEDYALWLRIAARTDFAYLSEPLVIYTDDPGQSVRRDDPDPITQKRRVIQDFLRWADKSGVSPAFMRNAEGAQFPHRVRTESRRLKHFMLRMKALVT